MKTVGNTPIWCFFLWSRSGSRPLNFAMSPPLRNSPTWAFAVSSIAVIARKADVLKDERSNTHRLHRRAAQRHDQRRNRNRRQSPRRKARCQTETADCTTAMPVGPNFPSSPSSLIGSLFPLTAKRHTGNRRHSTACHAQFRKNEKERIVEPACTGFAHDPHLTIEFKHTLYLIHDWTPGAEWAALPEYIAR